MVTKITEIIPDDIPQWAEDAMDRGQLFNEIVSHVDASRNLAIRWAYDDFLETINAGGDSNKIDMDDVMRRAEIDLG